MFTDEVGGNLCEVRLIEDYVNSESFAEICPENWILSFTLYWGEF